MVVAMPKRHRGYVAGSHRVSDRLVWSVRVKDPKSPYDGQWLVVASVHEGQGLARGLNVHFVIGTVDDSHGHKVARAADVCIEIADGELSA